MVLCLQPIEASLIAQICHAREIYFLAQHCKENVEKYCPTENMVNKALVISKGRFHQTKNIFGDCSTTEVQLIYWRQSSFQKGYTKLQMYQFRAKQLHFMSLTGFLNLCTQIVCFGFYHNILYSPHFLIMVQNDQSWNSLFLIFQLLSFLFFVQMFVYVL